MNLIEGLQHEANRRREAIRHYEAIGPAGAFGATMLRIDIDRAEKAIAGGDVIEMAKLYMKLKEANIN